MNIYFSKISLIATMCTNFLDHFLTLRIVLQTIGKKSKKRKGSFPLFSLFHSYEKPNQSQAWDLLEAKKKILVSFSHSLGLQPHVI